MKILVIGDSCTDKFIYGSTPRLAPEGPAPVFKPISTVENPGMAKNVVRNLESLGAEVEIITNPENIIKTRYVEEASNSLLLRVDENDNVNRIKTSILYSIPYETYDAILISDYNKGFLQPKDIAFIASNHSCVICDTKKQLNSWVKDLKFIKLNRVESKNNEVFIKENIWIQSKLIVTLDKDGCLHNGTYYTTRHVNIRDISGAGDTFISAFTYRYIITGSVTDAINFSNNASLEVIQKRGVSTL